MLYAGYHFVLNSLTFRRTTWLNILKMLVTIPCVMLVFIGLNILSSRYSLFYWMCTAILVLPIVIWSTNRFVLTAAIFLLASVLLALSPLDFTYKSGPAGLHLLPTSSGIATASGTVGYGCIARNIPPWALVLSF